MREHRDFLGGDGLKAKVTVDVPDRVYLNLFATIFIAATASGISIILLRKLVTKK